MDYCFYTIEVSSCILPQDIDRVLKTARDEYDALILGDHVLGPKRISLDRKAIEQFREYFDAINVWDGNFGETLHELQDQLAGDLGIPAYVASDSHTINPILRSATKFHELNLSTLETFRTSARQALRGESRVEFIYGSNGPLEKYRHRVSCLLAMAGLKAGLLKRER